MDYKNYLTGDILPFWLRNGIDNEQGGIFTCVDRGGKVYSQDKSVWFQGRALWTFSKAYNIIDKNEKYLEAAKRIFDFLPKCVDEDGRMFFIVTRDGRPIQKRRYYFSETFTAIGCAEYFKATKDKTAWELAEKFFDTAYLLYNNPSLTVPKFNTKTYRLKALSPVMILLATAQVMRSVGINENKYDEIAGRMLDEIINGGFLSSEVNAILENVSVDGNFCDSPSGRLVNPGHSLEAAWFIMAEGIIKNDKAVMQTAKQIIDWSMDKGIDKKYGGLYSFIDVMDKPTIQLEWDMKLWWPHNEAIIANMLAYKALGIQKYLDNYNMLMDYALANFADKEYGEWFGYLHYDGTPSHNLKGNIFKGPFHLPRMLMLLDSLNKPDWRFNL